MPFRRLDSTGFGFFIDSLSPSSVSFVIFTPTIKRLEFTIFLEPTNRRTIQPLLGPTVHPYALDNIMPQDMGDLPNVLRALFVPLGICRGGLGDIGPNFLAKGYVE